MTLDSVGKGLGLDMDIFSMMEKNIDELISRGISKEEVLEEIAWSGKDIVNNFRIIPRHSKWFLKEWSKRGYALKLIHSGHEESVTSLQDAIYFLGNIVFAGICLIAASFDGSVFKTGNFKNLSIAHYVLILLGFFFMLRSLSYRKK